jgi:ABC-type Fe3+ transport system substrate-binding protein
MERETVMRNLKLYVLPGLISAAMMAVPAGAAEKLPAATMKILTEMKLDPMIMEGLDKELAIPAAWVKGAKAEKELKVIGTWDFEQHKGYLAAFRERYPFLKINYVRQSRFGRTVKPLIALKEGRVLADVISGLGSAIFTYRASKALVDLRALPGFKHLPKGAKDEGEGLWVGHQFSYWCTAYNTTKVKPADLPKTWDGLAANPRWHGGVIGLGNRPNLWFLQLWGTKGRKWGRQYADKLFGTVKPQLRKEGMNALVALTIAGEFDMSMPSAEYRVSQMVAKGAPVKFHCPEPVPTTVQSVAAISKSKKLNAAKLYINWMLSREGQLAQYKAIQAAPVHPAFQRREFLSFPDQVIGKKTAFRTPFLLEKEWPRLLQFWRNKWFASSGQKIRTVTTKLVKPKRGGRRLTFMVGDKTHTVKISGSRTAIIVNGQQVARVALKAGMMCTFVYPGNKSEALEVICKK